MSVYKRVEIWECHPCWNAAKAMGDLIHMNTPRILDAFGASWLRRLYLAVCLALVLDAVPAQATTVIPPGFDQLVAQADYVVRAVVVSVTSELHAEGPHRHIMTKVELDVREVISGTPPQPLVLQLLGGKVGDEEMVVDGVPKFKVGDEDILFVHGNGRQFCPLVALMYGRFPIKRDENGREYMARASGSPLLSEQDVAKPMGPSVAGEAALRTPQATGVGGTLALSPADFANRIKSTANRGRGSKLEN